MENQETLPLDTGFIKVRLRAGGGDTDLWQAVDAGGVTAYFDAAGTAVVLPDVYEMVVLDGTICAHIG